MGEKSVQKKRYIVEKAREVFVEKGFKKVTMKDIVQACDISRGGLYLYFENTSQIFMEVLRMESEEVTKPDSSQTETVNHLGVYAIVNGRAVFKEAEVISEGADFYVLRSVTTGKNALRAGDELVLRGAGIFNGKLMEY